MIQTVENKILFRIYGRGRGWAFTKTDFIAEFGKANIHKALSSLARAGKIRRVFRGVYDYPRQSKSLGKTLSPDIDQVAQASARKFNWRILPSGDTALNLLGLSTQVPGRWVYLSDGPTRQYKIGRQTLVFRNSALKETGFKRRKSGLVVQALKALGKERVDQNTIEAIRKQMDPKDYKHILKDTRSVTDWIYRFIKQICRERD